MKDSRQIIIELLESYLRTQTIAFPQTTEELEDGNPPQTIETQTLVFKDFDELTDKQIKAIESIKQGRNGIELKLHSKTWTIERICKMLGFDAPERFEGELIDKRVQVSPLNEIPIQKLKEMRKILNDE